MQYGRESTYSTLNLCLLDIRRFDMMAMGCGGVYKVPGSHRDSIH